MRGGAAVVSAVAGLAHRLDHGRPAVVKCGLCPGVAIVSGDAAGLRAANARLRELLAERDAQVAELRALVADLQAQVAELAARAGQNFEELFQATEYQMIEMECPCCEDRTKADAPQGVDAPVQYAPRVAALGTYLWHGQFLSRDRACGGVQCGPVLQGWDFTGLTFGPRSCRPRETDL